jgi:predicted metal-binding membrane protein
LAQITRSAIERWPWLGAVASLRGAALGLFVTLLLLTGAAWALTLRHALGMRAAMGVATGGVPADGSMAGMVMAGMPAGGWSFAAAASFLVIWTVMMAAMMLPAAAPMIAIFAAAQARRHRDVAVPTWIFVAGYLLVWAVAGVLVYLLVQIGGDLASRVAAAERARWGPLALGTTLLAAGAYQLTPLKRVCSAIAARLSPSWRSTGRTAASVPSGWAFGTGAIAWAVAGRCLPSSSPPG